MPFITDADDFIADTTERAISALDFEARRLAALQDPTLRELIKANPDASIHFSRWGTRAIEVAVEITLDRADADNPLYDISTLPGVGADDQGYNYTHQEDLPITIGAGALPVRRTISISQPYSEEERDLLTRLGKLHTQASTYTYTALVCGV